jgi:cell wall-associated NlpC family hydrolase
VYAAYRSIGWKIPRSSWDQLRAGRPVRFARLLPGDLLFTEGGGADSKLFGATKPNLSVPSGRRTWRTRPQPPSC